MGANMTKLKKTQGKEQTKDSSSCTECINNSGHIVSNLKHHWGHIVSNLKHGALEKPRHKLIRSEPGPGIIGLINMAKTTIPQLSPLDWEPGSLPILFLGISLEEKWQFPPDPFCN
jgi:hypothetical protein